MDYWNQRWPAWEPQATAVYPQDTAAWNPAATNAPANNNWANTAYEANVQTVTEIAGRTTQYQEAYVTTTTTLDVALTATSISTPTTLLTSTSTASTSTSTSTKLTSSSTSTTPTSTTSTPTSTPTPTQTSTSSPTSKTLESKEPEPESGGLSPRTKAAIAAPIAIIGTLALLLAIFFFCRRRRNKNSRYMKSASHVTIVPDMGSAFPRDRSWDAGILPAGERGTSTMTQRDRGFDPVPSLEPIPRVEVSRGLDPGIDGGRRPNSYLPPVETGFRFSGADYAHAGNLSRVESQRASIIDPGTATSTVMTRSPLEDGRDGQGRPTSPFDHPLDHDSDEYDDAVSEVSRWSARRERRSVSGRGADAEADRFSFVSSVSSIGERGMDRGRAL